jgi:hypothetical protein
MRNDTKDSLEYRRELLEWQTLYFRLKRLLENKEGERWDAEKENVELWWAGMRKTLAQLYQQPEWPQ